MEKVVILLFEVLLHYVVQITYAILLSTCDAHCPLQPKTLQLTESFDF